MTLGDSPGFGFFFEDFHIRVKPKTFEIVSIERDKSLQFYLHLLSKNVADHFDSSFNKYDKD